MLRVHLFGSGRLFHDGHEVRLRSRIWTLPILAYLVLHRGELVPRKRLAFVLWPDEPEETALVQLRRNLYRLTQALPEPPGPDPWIVTTGHTISWNPAAPFELDCAEFERLRSGEETRAQAVEIYDGDFLPDLSDDWIAAERERLRGLYHADLSTLVRAHRSRRDFAGAARYAKYLLTSDPWHEEGLRALMSVRYEGGDASGALAEFDAFACRLRAELHVEPMPETLALRGIIARGGTIPSTLGVAEVSPSRAPDRSPFVGRVEELGRLSDLWLRAARGNGHLAFVRGEGGIGKSRLVSELALIAGAQGGRVLAGTTSLPEHDPYQCLSSALRDALPLAAGLSLAPPFFAALAEIVPQVRAYRPDIPALAGLDPSSEHARLLDAIAQTLSGLARPRPLLVILEDLHRAGAATLGAIAGIVPRLARSPVFIVATCRTEGVERTHPLRALFHDTRLRAEVLDVGPLSPHEVKQLVDATDGGPTSSPALLAALLQKTAGNPLFVTEFLRDGQLAKLVPASVKAMMTERVASLKASGRTVADIAAVAGEAFTVEIVREVARLPASELLDGLDELLDRHLIRESIDVRRYEYAFTHHLIRAAIYDAIPADVRMRRHRRIARLLDADFVRAADADDERAIEIALHCERGGDSERAAAYYATAARRAARLHAHAEARDLVGRSLALAPGTDRDRFDLLLLRVTALTRLADATAENADLLELERLAARLDDDAMCAALECRIDFSYRQGDHTGEVAASDLLERHARACANPRRLATASEARAKRRLRDHEPSRAIEYALEARSLYELAGDVASCARVTGLAAFASGPYAGKTEDAKRFASEALELAERAGDPGTRLTVYRFAARVALDSAGDLVRATEIGMSALAIALEIGDRIAEAGCREIVGNALMLAWRIDESAMQLREAKRLAESLGLVQQLRVIDGNLATLFGEIGAFELCRALFSSVLQKALESHSLANALHAIASLADIAWQCGDVAALSKLLIEGRALAEGSQESRFVANLRWNEGRLLRCRREFEASATVLEQAVSFYDEAGRRDLAADVLNDLAITLLGAGQAAAAHDAMARSATMVDGNLRRLHDPTRYHWVAACLLRETGLHEEAAHALGLASAEYLEKYATLQDRAFRACFAAIPCHRAVRAAIERDEWPHPHSPCVVAFPGPSAPGTMLLEARTR